MSYSDNGKPGYYLPTPYGRNRSTYFIDTKDFPVEKIPSPATAIKTGRGGRCIPRRYICVLLGFWSSVLLTTQRLNLSMGMVAMVNHTALHPNLGENSTLSDCTVETIMISSQHYADQHEVEGHLHWDTETQNHILSASYLGFVLTQIPGGRMSETIGAKQVLVFSLVVASLCNVVSPIASEWGAYVLMVVQFVKGLGQGLTQPAVSYLMVMWFPKQEKGFLASLTFSGYPCGAVIGGLLLGVMCDSDFLGGWPMGFYSFGFLGLILSLLVHKFSYNSPEEDYGITESEYKYIVSNIESRNTGMQLRTPWKPMASTVGTWALLFGTFGQYWIIFYFLAVHPTYLGSVLHFTNTESGYLNSLPYIGQMLVTWSSSYLCDKIVNKGYASTDVVRKICNSLSCIGFSVSLLLVTYVGCDKMLNITLFVIAISTAGFGYPGSNIVALDMTIAFAGTFMGITSTFASCSGFIIPLVVGSITSQEQTLVQWRKVFYISSAVSLISGIIFALFGSAKLQDWDSPNADEKKISGLVNEGFDATSDKTCSVRTQDVRDSSDVFSQQL